MPRYDAANLAAVSKEYRDANNIGSGGGGSNNRYMYGNETGNNGVFVLSGAELLAQGATIRLLPIYEDTTSENREFVPFREGRDGVAFGDWGRLWTCAHWVGNPGICFNIHDGNPNVNLYDSPLHLLSKAAWDSAKRTPHPTLGRLFSDLLSKSFQKDSHIGSLKRPEKTLFISATFVYTDASGKTVLGTFTEQAAQQADAGGKAAKRDPRNARIIGLKTSAQESLYAALRVRDENTGAYLCDDMLSLGDAQLFTVLPDKFNSGSPNLIAHSDQGPATFQCPRYARSPSKDSQYIVGYPKSRSDYTHFGIVHSTFNGQPVSLEAHAEQIVADTKTWTDYLRLPSYEEQAALLAPLFPREALDYAWREWPEYVSHVAKGTSTFTGHDVPVGDLQPAHHQKTVAKQPAVDSGLPPAPWDPPTGEISSEDDSAIADMFAGEAASVPPGAATAPPVMPVQAAPAKRDSAEILARARARAAATKKA